MRALNGRVERLERSHAVHRMPEGEEAALMRRIEEVMPLVPTPALELLWYSLKADGAGEPLTAEPRVAREQWEELLATGEWPLQRLAAPLIVAFSPGHGFRGGDNMINADEECCMWTGAARQGTVMTIVTASGAPDVDDSGNSDELAEFVHNVGDDAIDTHQDAIDGIVCWGRCLIERYVRYEREVHVGVALWDGRDYCASFHRALRDEDYIGCAHRQSRIPEPPRCGSSQQVEVPVLVDVTKCLEMPQRRAPEVVLSMARLKVLDQSHCSRRYPAQPIWRAGRKFVPIVANQKVVSRSGDCAVGDDELPDQMVKRRAEVVERVADQRGQRGGWGRKVSIDAPALFAGFGIKLSHQGVELRTESVEEGLNFQLNGILVCPCALKFRLHAVQTCAGQGRIALHAEPPTFGVR